MPVTVVQSPATTRRPLPLMRGVLIAVDAGVGEGHAVWTCDLTHGYIIFINASYRSPSGRAG